MGINKLDVRFVIHYSMSKSLENYYQETGRAGRDGELAHCILLFRFNDVFRATSLMVSEPNGRKNVYNIAAYCVDKRTCRKKLLARYFNDKTLKERGEECGGLCDNCDTRTQLKQVDCRKYIGDLYNLIENAGNRKEKMTPLKLVDAWTGKGAKNLRLDSVKPPTLTRAQCEHAILLMLIDGFLMEEFHFTPYSTISYLKPGPKAALLPAQIPYRLPVHSSGSSASISFGSTPAKSTPNKSNGAKRSTSSSNQKLQPQSSHSTVNIDDEDDDEDFVYEPKKKEKKISNITIDEDDECIELE